MQAVKSLTCRIEFGIGSHDGYFSGNCTQVVNFGKVGRRTKSSASFKLDGVFLASFACFGLDAANLVATSLARDFIARRRVFERVC